jgi:hypothetical protein
MAAPNLWQSSLQDAGWKIHELPSKNNWRKYKQLVCVFLNFAAFFAAGG